jgi:hypothetical protein
MGELQLPPFIRISDRIGGLTCSLRSTSISFDNLWEPARGG